MDSYLSIVGLALAIAALVPILFPTTRIKLWTVTAALLSIVILVIGFQVYKEVAENRAVRTSKDEILILLKNNKKGLSFEQIYDNMYYPNFSIANAAIDELVSEGKVLNDKVEAIDQSGVKFVVRRFYSQPE